MTMDSDRKLIRSRPSWRHFQVMLSLLTIIDFPRNCFGTLARLCARRLARNAQTHLEPFKSFVIKCLRGYDLTASGSRRSNLIRFTKSFSPLL